MSSSPKLEIVADADDSLQKVRRCALDRTGALDVHLLSNPALVADHDLVLGQLHNGVIRPLGYVCDLVSDSPLGPGAEAAADVECEKPPSRAVEHHAARVPDRLR